MKTQTLIRWAGAAAIVGGIINVVLSLPPMEAVAGLPFGYVVGSAAIMYGLIGIYAVQAEGSGVVGLAGFLLALLGNAYFIGPQGPVAGVEGTMVYGSIYALGLVLLAIGSLRARRFPRWAPWMWIVAVVIGLPGAFVPELGTLPFLLGALAYGVGFAGAGYTLWRGKTAAR